MGTLGRLSAATLVWFVAFFAAFFSTSLSSPVLEAAAWLILSCVAALLGLLLLPQSRFPRALALQLTACYVAGVAVRFLAIGHAHWAPSSPEAVAVGILTVFGGVLGRGFGMFSAVGPLLAVALLYWAAVRIRLPQHSSPYA